MRILRNKHKTVLRDPESLNREPAPVRASSVVDPLASLVGRLTVVPVSAFATTPRNSTWAKLLYQDLAKEKGLLVAGACPEKRGDLYMVNIRHLVRQLGKVAEKDTGRHSSPVVLRTQTDVGHSTFGHAGDFCTEVAQYLEGDDAPIALFVDDITGAAILEANARAMRGFALEVAEPTRHELLMTGVRFDAQPTWTVRSSPLYLAA